MGEEQFSHTTQDEDHSFRAAGVVVQLKKHLKEEAWTRNGNESIWWGISCYKLDGHGYWA